MSQETLLITVKDESTAQVVRDFIHDMPETQTKIISSKHLDGDWTTWILVATLAAQVLPDVLDFITTLLDKDKVQEITVGELTIRNPTREDVENLLRMHLKQ
jgi:hypothetical protein